MKEDFNMDLKAKYWA